MKTALATTWLVLSLSLGEALAEEPPWQAPAAAPGAALSLSVLPGSVLAALGGPGGGGAGSDRSGADGEEPAGAPSKPSLDFDLLGEPEAPPPRVDGGAIRLRRGMLEVHQGIGFGLAALQLATTAVGQLNYSDRFAGGPDTARYRLTHKVLAYSTLGVFAANGLVALLAPTAGRGGYRLDRVMLHRIAMAAAALGMTAQAVLGIRTRDRTGYLDQERSARIHLAIGYATLAAFALGVVVLVI